MHLPAWLSPGHRPWSSGKRRPTLLLPHSPGDLLPGWMRVQASRTPFFAQLLNAFVAPEAGTHVLLGLC